MKYDIIVVGAGVNGLASAYHLKERHPKKNILIIEKNDAAGKGATGRNCVGFRNIYYSQHNFLLADTTVNFLKHVNYDLNYDLGMEVHGYFWILNESYYRYYKGIVNDLRNRNPKLKLELLDRAQMKQISPDLVLDFNGDEEAKALGMEDIVGGIYAPEAGSFDDTKLVKFYEEGFEKSGGKILYNTRVEKLITEPKNRRGIPGEEAWQNPKVVGVRTQRWDYRADTVIVAAGWWAPLLLDPIGIDCLFKPLTVGPFFILTLPNYDEVAARNKFAFVFEPYSCGLVASFRRTTKQFKVKIARTSWPFVDAFAFEDDLIIPDKKRDFQTTAFRFLRKYYPIFEKAQLVDIRPPGQYQYNSLDQNPVIVAKAGLIYVGGISGSGMHKCDALGRIVAAAYDGEERAELFGGVSFKISDLSIEKRRVDREVFVL